MSKEEPWTIGRLLDWTTRYLETRGAESARLEAQLLLAHALGVSRTHLYTHHDAIPPEDQRGQFRDLVQKRVKGTPVAYLLGRKDFFLLDFEVGPSVLVPRSDTECVVAQSLPLVKPLAAPRILDVGTGSGCLAVALAVNHKGAQVTATDISPDALAVARRNADRHKVGDRVRFLPGDLLEPIPPGEVFDLIVSNPPYIRTDVIPTLAADVRDHEPRLALDGGPDGLAVIRRLVAGAGARLAPGGHLVFEIGHDQEYPARDCFDPYPGFTLGKTVRDDGGQPRVLIARWQAPGA